jgi:hypothetical protein
VRLQKSASPHTTHKFHRDKRRARSTWREVGNKPLESCVIEHVEKFPGLEIVDGEKCGGLYELPDSVSSESGQLARVSLATLNSHVRLSYVSKGASRHATGKGLEHQLMQVFSPAVALNPARWEMMARNSPPTCALDTLLSELETIGRRYESQHLRFPEFVDMACPSVASLLGPERTPPVQQQMSRNESRAVISSILVGHVTIAMSLKSKVYEFASVWTLFNLLRWRMCQSEDTFAAIPHFLRPTALQLAIPHAAFIDTYPWPSVRDCMIQYLDPSRYNQFRRMICKTFRIRWPHSTSACVINTGNGEYTLSPEFQHHLRSLDNWCLTQAAVDEFPFLHGIVNIYDDPITEMDN